MIASPSDQATFATIGQVVDAARAKLPKRIWDSSFAGAGSETTLRRNRSEFDSLAFRPRLLRGVANVDLTTHFAGHQLSMPVMLAPVGGIAHFDPGGGLTWLRAASRAGTAGFVSMGSAPQPRRLDGVDLAPRFLQLYTDGDRDWLAGFARQAEDMAYQGICLTADAPTYPRLDRILENAFNPRENPANDDGIKKGASSDDCRAAFNWDDLAYLRQLTKLRLILKGVMTAEDAELAIAHGVDVIYVSNHGGRATDHLPSTVEVLPEIVRAVAGRAEIVVDSGYMRGSDVVKALALGANAVLIGRLGAWALAAGGEDALVQVLDILRTEIRTTMAGIGAVKIADLGPHCLIASRPPEDEPWPAYA
jgi:isopentenyl diphosphate isomerase/L-lactate dehydrogenase-like FMN-dependent dehydrogenase